MVFAKRGANMHPLLHPQMPQSATAPYRCCPLLSRFEYIDRRACVTLALFAIKTVASCVGIWTPCNTWFLGLTGGSIPNVITIGSAGFPGLTGRDRQTDRPRYSVCSYKAASS